MCRARSGGDSPDHGRPIPNRGPYLEADSSESDDDNLNEELIEDISAVDEEMVKTHELLTEVAPLDQEAATIVRYIQGIRNIIRLGIEKLRIREATRLEMLEAVVCVHLTKRLADRVINRAATWTAVHGRASNPAT